jgi:hypothetical protein
MMLILVEITYEDGTVENFSINSNLEKNNDTARKKYMLLRKQSENSN